MNSAIKRLSFNTITAKSLTLQEVIDECTLSGVGYIAPWRDLIMRTGIQQSAKLISDSGLSISSLCRGGMFTAVTPQERRDAIEDNLRAIDEAAAIGSPVLVLVCGPIVGRDLYSSQQMVIEGIVAIADYAAKAQVTLGIEPLHPMMALSRSCVTTVRQALDIADQVNDNNVKLIIDAYHVWSDPHLFDSTARIKERIAGFHISDWVTPITNELASRAMPGEGCIDLLRLKNWVESAGYVGAIEVEVLSDFWWAQNPHETFQKAVDSFRNLDWGS